MPELEAAVRGRDDAALVTVMFGGSPRHAQAVRRQTGLRAPVLLDVAVSRSGHDGAQTLRARYGIRQVPWTLVVNAGGRAVKILNGAHDRERFVKELDALE